MSRSNHVLVLIPCLLGTVLMLGCPPFIVPNIVGLLAENATTQLETDGLIVGELGYEYNESVRVGHVIRQIPPAGSNVAPSFIVTFVVSLGPNPNAPLE